jgi:hypothetical protein
MLSKILMQSNQVTPPAEELALPPVRRNLNHRAFIGIIGICDKNMAGLVGFVIES